jgi:hypothetical protein
MNGIVVQDKITMSSKIGTGLVAGQKSVAYPPLVDPGKIYLPPLHIKLGLMKNFVKAVNTTGPGFQYLQTKFPHISEA